MFVAMIICNYLFLLNLKIFYLFLPYRVFCVMDVIDGV